MKPAQVADALAQEAARAVQSANGYADQSPKRAFELERANVLSRGAVTIRHLTEVKMNDARCGRCRNNLFTISTAGVAGDPVSIRCKACDHVAVAPSVAEAFAAIALKAATEDAAPPKVQEGQAPPAPEGGYVE